MTIYYSGFFQARVAAAEFREAIKMWWNDGTEFFCGVQVPDEYKNKVLSVEAARDGNQWVVRVALSDDSSYDLCTAGLQDILKYKRYLDSVDMAADLLAYRMFGTPYDNMMQSHMYEEVNRISRGITHERAA